MRTIATSLLLSLCACTGAKDDSAAPDTSGDTASPALTIETAAQVREVVLVLFTMPANLIMAAPYYIADYSPGNPCPPVVSTGEGAWQVGYTSADDSCHATDGSGVTWSGGYAASGVVFGDDGQILTGQMAVDWSSWRDQLSIEDMTFDETADGAIEAEVNDGLADGPAGGDLTVLEIGAGATFVAGDGYTQRTWDLQDFQTDNLFSAQGSSGPVPISGRVGVDGAGFATIAGEVQWDPGVCSSEPVAGSLTVTGTKTVTVTMDGATNCDGSSSISGDFTGSLVAWSSSGSSG